MKLPQEKIRETLFPLNIKFPVGVKYPNQFRAQDEEITIIGELTVDDTIKKLSISYPYGIEITRLKKLLRATIDTFDIDCPVEDYFLMIIGRMEPIDPFAEVELACAEEKKVTLEIQTSETSVLLRFK